LEIKDSNRVKIAIMSDSHDNTENSAQAVNIANERGCEALFHLGDITSPFCAEQLSAFHGRVSAVFGNCDGEVEGLKKTFNSFGGDIQKPPFELEVDNQRMILLHEPILLDDLIHSDKIDYIFYGHLHTVDLRQERHIYILNPGEIGGWVHHQPSFFILNTKLSHFDKIELQKN